MKAGVLHCRCPKCFSVPLRRRVQKRVPSRTLLSLPDEVLLCVFQWLSAEDLLAVRAVHSRFRDIINNNSSVWGRVSFRDTWPAPNTVWLFERAAEKGNFEAAVKLGIAYLYNEGPHCHQGRADLCGAEASRFFSLAEGMRSPTADPFVWVFIRPPWSPNGSCCKSVVFDHLRDECNANRERKGSLLHCLARVLQHFEEPDRQAEALPLLEESSAAGCLQSSYLLWEHNRNSATADPGRYLQCVRTLRDYAAKGSWEAQLSLAKVCSAGNPLGLEAKACAGLVAQLFSSRLPAPHPRTTPRHLGIMDTMRYILVDWLVEVTTMKEFSSQTLHVTVNCVDRYLALRTVPKARLQLLGIACMVVCTRYISKDILTIREAVWLTDNTYKYEDLVRMMGEVVAVLQGNIRSPTLLDYSEVLLALLPMEQRSAFLFSYVCELSLLYSGLAALPRPALASAALLLTRTLHHYAPIWPSHLADYTGFSKQDLVPLVLQLHVKCFSQDKPKDGRHVGLTGVKQRFEDEAYQHISKEEVIVFRELCQMLEISDVEAQELYQMLDVPEEEPSTDTASPTDTAPPADMTTFLSSPTSHSKRRREEESVQAHRGSFVATPTSELSNQEEKLLGDMLDWSLDASCSYEGYEGDHDGDSSGERDLESSIIELELATSPEGGVQRCRALSSDEDDSFCEAEQGGGSAQSRPRDTAFSLALHSLSASADLHSSGYSSSSAQGASPPSSSSGLLPCTFTALPPVLAAAAGSAATASAGFRLLVPVQRSRSDARRQVKRKNAAAHSGGETEPVDVVVDDAAHVGLHI